MKNIKIIFLFVVAGLFISLQHFYKNNENYIFFKLDKKQKLPFSDEEMDLILSPSTYKDNFYLSKINDNLYLSIAYHPDLEIKKQEFISMAITYENSKIGYIYNYYNLSCEEKKKYLICQRSFDDNQEYLFYRLNSPFWEDLEIPQKSIEKLFLQLYETDKSVSLENYFVSRISENKYAVLLNDKNYCGGSAGCWSELYLFQDNKLNDIGDFGAMDCNYDYEKGMAICSRTFADNH